MDALIFVLLGLILATAAFWSRSRFADFLAQKPEDYRSGENFDLRTFLNGPMICDGVIYGPTGRVSSRFAADFDITWEGNNGVMKEHFTYDDGSEQHREWRFSYGNDGRIVARAEDVVGDGEGEQIGSAIRLKYKFRLPPESGGHVLDCVDWMYLAPNGTIVNRSQFYKFGIKVAELFATMRPTATEMKRAA